MLCFASLYFVCGEGAVACRGLLCSCERETDTRYGLLCFVCSCEEKAATCYDLLCIALVPFKALLWFALHCIARLWTD